MAEGVADYPSHREVLAYFRAFFDRFDLRSHYRFNAEINRTEPLPRVAAPSFVATNPGEVNMQPGGTSRPGAAPTDLTR